MEVEQVCQGSQHLELEVEVKTKKLKMEMPVLRWIP
jgi:hypothetical protein